MRYIDNFLVVYYHKTICLISVAAFLVLQVSCKSSTHTPEERIERFETGAISRRVMIIDGKREGEMTDYYPDGKLMGRRWFKNGRQEGKTLIYYPTGTLKEVQYYKDGEQHGGDTLWYENGKTQFTVYFQNNKKNGYLRKWSPEGALVFESKYSLDTLMEVKGVPVSRASIDARHASDTIIKPKKQ